MPQGLAENEVVVGQSLDDLARYALRRVALRVIEAEGEAQVSVRLAEAAKILGAEPAAIQLRYLQTLSEIAIENNSTIIFPVPVDMMRAFMPVVGEGGVPSTKGTGG